MHVAGRNWRNPDNAFSQRPYSGSAWLNPNQVQGLCPGKEPRTWITRRDKTVSLQCGFLNKESEKFSISYKITRQTKAYCNSYMCLCVQAGAEQWILHLRRQYCSAAPLPTTPPIITTLFDRNYLFKNCCENAQSWKPGARLPGQFC